MSKIATRAMFGANLLACALPAQSEALVLFVIGGYASGLLTREMFNKNDADRDNTISRDEFIHYQLKIFDMMEEPCPQGGARPR